MINYEFVHWPDGFCFKDIYFTIIVHAVGVKLYFMLIVNAKLKSLSRLNKGSITTTTFIYNFDAILHCV